MCEFVSCFAKQNDNDVIISVEHGSSDGCDADILSRKASFEFCWETRAWNNNFYRVSWFLFIFKPFYCFITIKYYKFMVQYLTIYNLCVVTFLFIDRFLACKKLFLQLQTCFDGHSKCYLRRTATCDSLV